MTQLLPQEFEVWYLIPAIRREISRILLEEHKYKQKEVAQLLGISEGAISQYKAAKRGQGLTFKPKEQKEIAAYTQKIIQDKAHINMYIYDLCKILMGSNSICELHKKLDTTLPNHCDLCSGCRN